MILCRSKFARFLKSANSGDRYGGDWPPERFRTHGIVYQAAEETKSDLYRELLPALNAQRVELLDVPRLRAQLLGLERRTGRSGRDSIDHGPGAHDDLANATAGALLLVGGRPGVRLPQFAPNARTYTFSVLDLGRRLELADMP